MRRGFSISAVVQIAGVRRPEAFFPVLALRSEDQAPHAELELEQKQRHSSTQTTFQLFV